ncbi:MAG: hypothetical protein HY538_07370 [Deltaproteobacteria bacterium]|nr:hypothetical protein [Deltaproteobacteria bacterium]
MMLIDFIQFLREISRKHHKRIFLLREIVALTGESPASIGMTLLRAQKKGLVTRVKKYWINQMDPPQLEELAFTLASPSYISFESALYRHQILSQSPRGGLTVATRSRPRCITTSLGTLQLIHLKPALFFGYDSNRVALPEKAWLDLLYIRGLQGRKGVISEKFYLEHLNQKRLVRFEKKFPAWVRQLRKSLKDV